VLPCRNEQGYIQACLQSALDQDPPEGGFEIIVADGMSTDGTREYLEQMAKQHPQLRILDNPGRIVSTGLNAAIRAARGDIIVRMDAHTIYAPEYVRQCLAVMNETGADNVGGPWRTVPFDDSFGSKMVAAILTNPFGVGDSRFRTSSFEGFVETVPFGAFRRELFDRVGLYDEKLVRNQDNELNARIRQAGGKIYQTPALTTEYHPVAKVTSLLKQTYKTSQWHIFSVRENAFSMGIRHFVPAAFVLLLCGLLAGIFWNPRSLAAVGVLLALYLLAGFYFAIRRRRDYPLAVGCALPFVCLVFHISYGLGTIAGLRYLFVAPPSTPIRAGQAVNPG